jgi:hypothetical protein
MMRWLISMAILLPLAIGGGLRRAEPNYPKLEDCPFAADPNLVVGKLLACLQVELGQRMIHTRMWYDPEGDPVEVRILKGPEGVQIVNRPKTGSYTILWTPRQVMIAAIVVQATDQPVRGRPGSDTGTILVQVLPGRQRLVPRGCGAPPS